jgi:hypothetical protein
LEWEQEPRAPLEHGYLGLANKVIGVVEQELVKQINLHDGTHIDAMAHLYWDSAWELKKYNGTSEQWPWLAEFMVFWIIKKKLEDRVGPLRPKKHTRYMHKFVDTSGENMLFHSNLPELVKGKKIKPDVSLYRKGKLLFTIDVKVAVADSKALIESLRKLIVTSETLGSRPFLVVLAKSLTFSVDTVRPAVKKFADKQGIVIGPKGGKLKEKMDELEIDLCDFDEIFNLL